MSRSARGHSEQHGRQVKQKASLNRSIVYQGWGDFKRQLEYKTQWLGGILIAVPSHYSSQECPVCHFVSQDNRKTQAKFSCVECGFGENADLVVAINILVRGHRVSARRETVQSVRSVKQEPVEAIVAIAA